MWNTTEADGETPRAAAPFEGDKNKIILCILKRLFTQSLYHNHQVQTCPDVTVERERYPPIRGERFGAFRERQMVNCLETDLPARPTQSHSQLGGGGVTDGANAGVK